ncbi:hypothetical protein SLE2022_175540 [Rubroshorea leprosula]
MDDNIDEMDSLFEGMVLFTPSQLVDQDLHPPPSESGDAPAPAEVPPPSSISSPQPLDENLFSDLTLITPLQTLDDQPGPSSASVSRQISKKKRKTTGFRIGYGRDTPFDDHDDDDSGNSHPSAPFDHTPSPDPHERHQSDAESIGAESKLELLKVKISDKLNHARELAASVSAARKESIRRRREVANRFNLATIRYSELEKQLEDACEAENFEAADRISQSLVAAEKDKQTLLTALRDAESQCDAIDSKMQEVLLSQIAAEEECASMLLHFSEDAVNNADLVLKKAEAQSAEERETWFSSTETLEFKKIELEIKMHLVDDARDVLNGSLDNLIEEDKKEEELLSKKRDILTDELQKLLALVKEKEKEIADYDSKMKEVKERIADVVSNFQEMQLSINAKHVDLQTGISQVDMEREVLSKKKKEIDKLLAEEEDSGAKLRKLASICADEAKIYQEGVGLRNSLMSSILKSREEKVRLAKSEEKLSEDVRVLKQEVSAERASLQELSSTKSTVQQNIASLRHKIFFIEKRVPELEAEKKVAAAARNFKEAARIAAEAKSLTVEKDGLQIEMEKAIVELGKVEEEIKCTIEKLQEIEGLISSKENEVALARIQRLLHVAGAAKAERSAALELGDQEEANLLLAEAEAADSEANELQSSYNFKEGELANLPKHFISMELVANLGQKKLAELAASIHSATK